MTRGRPRRFSERNDQGRGARALGLLRNGLMVHQAIEAMNVSHGRKLAEKEAAENKRRIEGGVVSGRLQKASLGTIEDAEAIGLFNGAGPILGYLEGRRAQYGGDMSLSCLGPAGTGKTTTLGMVELVRSAGKESIIALDLKDGELSWATAEARAELDGIEPTMWNPWGIHNWGTCRINPFQGLIDRAKRGEPIVDDVKSYARICLGDPKEDGENGWLRADATTIAEMVITEYAEHEPELCHPGALWDFANKSHEDFGVLCDLWRHSPAGGGFVATVANALHDQYGEERTKQFSWVMKTLADAFALYGKGSMLRDVVSTTDIDIASFKHRPRTLYIVLPDHYAHSHGPVVSLLLDYVFDVLGREKGTVRTTVLADEWSNFPRVDAALKVLRLYRSKNVRLWTFVQDRDGYHAYEAEGGYRPFEANTVQLIWGLDASHAKDIEIRAGYNAVAVPGVNTSAGVNAPGAGVSAGEQVTPILPVSEIARIAAGRAILLIPGEKVFILDRLPYWAMPDIAPWVRNVRQDPPADEGA